MNISDLSQAILLLTAYLPGGDESSPIPLGTAEYNHLAQWLVAHQASPVDLLDAGHSEALLAQWQDTQIEAGRLRRLLQRGGALALALDKWLRAGLWVVNRSDADYPPLIRQRLKKKAPPVFFGVGEAQLLHGKAIGVVGSRDASEADLDLAGQLGRQIAQDSHSVVSGGAKGIDEASMLGALDAQGTAIGYLADSLLRQAASKRYRDHLIDGRLVLLSPFSPEARFHVGNAMARNKYIYLQSQATVVIHAGRKGETWAGAEENLAHQWVPLWIKPNLDADAGNSRLIQMGGCPLPEAPAKWTPGYLVQTYTAASQGDLFAQAQPPDIRSTPEPVEGLVKNPKPKTQEARALFHFFLAQLRSVAADQPLTPDLVGQRLDLTPDQARHWLQVAAAQDLLVSAAQPDTFRWK
ncbi:MAG: DNA-processing protein DprA [Bacteroidia bacterium]